MLCLKRELEEKIVIRGNGEIVITVLKVIGKTVQLGFEGDRSVSVLRKEVDGPRKDAA